MKGIEVGSVEYGQLGVTKSEQTRLYKTIDTRKRYMQVGSGREERGKRQNSNQWQDDQLDS